MWSPDYGTIRRNAGCSNTQSSCSSPNLGHSSCNSPTRTDIRPRGFGESSQVLDRIATATRSARAWDSNDGHLLVDIPVAVTPWYSIGRLWFNDHLFVVSDSTIKRIEASSGSTVSEWPVPDSSRFSCITLPKHGEASHTQHSVLSHFWARRHTPSSVSSNSLETYVRSQSHQTTSFSQLV